MKPSQAEEYVLETNQEGVPNHFEEEDSAPKSKEMLEWEEAVKRWINR